MDWIEENNALKSTIVFADFTTAFAFMTEVAFAAEKLNHHPNWTNIYNKVIFELQTHDAGNTVTEKDFLLAKKITKIAQKYLP